MNNTNDTHIKRLRPVMSPALLLEELPISDKAAQTVAKARTGIANVLQGKDDRLVIVVGPCSIHDLKAAKEYALSFPYLYDETQEIAKAYKAVCTPDFSIFDADLSCVYRGQLDDSRPGRDVPITGNDIRQALDAILAEKVVNELQKPSIGCSIKWKGQAPY